MTSQQASELFAESSEITEDDIAEARSLIGTKLRLPAPFNTIVTADAVRQFAECIGDDNPLWRRTGDVSKPLPTMIAPPTFLYSVFAPGIWPGFAGLQSFQGGNSWDFKRPLRLGDHLIPTATLMDVKDVQGKRSGRTIIEEGFTEFHTPAGELVATAVSRSFRKPRAGYKDAMRVEPRAPHKLGDAEIEELEARIISYVRRGSVPRYWEDTKVGQRLDERIKGPLQFPMSISMWRPLSASPISSGRRRCGPTSSPISASGDRNPLHSDPLFAARGGFARPDPARHVYPRHHEQAAHQRCLRGRPRSGPKHVRTVH
jgi:acyl dehydratase